MRNFIGLSLLSLLISGCNTYTSDRNITQPYYVDDSLLKEKKLEFPPGLSLEIAHALQTPSTDQLNDLARVKQKYSLFDKNNPLKPKYNAVENDSWVELKVSYKALWHSLKSFWAFEGFKYTHESIDNGTVITSWQLNLNRHYPQGLLSVEATIDDWLTESHQDRYLLTIKPSKKKGTVELRMNHESMRLAEVNDKDSWVLQPENRFYREAMLIRMLQFIGYNLEESSQAISIVGLNQPFQFFQNDYAESYLVIPDTPYRTLFFLEKALAKSKHTFEKETDDRFINLNLKPCILVTDDNNKKISACSFKIFYAERNTLVIALDSKDKSLSVSASRNLFNKIAIQLKS